MNSNIAELFTISTLQQDADWRDIVEAQSCPYLDRKCVKTRKSQPEISIGTCSAMYGVKAPSAAIICPQRFLERGQVFLDCLHLLTLHEPGNELHKIAELDIPGGSVDYVLASVHSGQIVDFVGIELQSIDTTGTLWPTRQKFLDSVGIAVDDLDLTGTYGLNWKMTAKTTLVQLHHKIETFEALGKHLVLVLQNKLLEYMRREFNFGHIQDAKLGHSMHFHSYSLTEVHQQYRIDLASRYSTDAAGIAVSLGLQASANMELDVIISLLQRKISPKTLLRI